MQVRNIPLSEIVPSELNPRKTFDQEELQELAQSIKENGLVQPITLRKSANKKDGKYEIVCGERRFRACQIIGEKTIQAVVKELDDKQAFTCMIIENLQRKDIDPMEEAAALGKLFNEKTMTISEMAKLLGKSTSFVVGRIQLNQTIPEFVMLMKDGVLVLTHLLDICKLTEEQQKVLYETCFTEDCRARWTYKFPNMPQLHEMIDEHVMNLLSKANFSIDDDTFENAPACAVCPLNTKNNPDTFNDVTRPRCMKRECYIQKSMTSIFRMAKSLGYPVVYAGEYTENEEILQNAEKAGLEVVGVGDRRYVINPVAPDESSFQDKETYEKRLWTYKKVKAVFDSNLSDGTVQAVFEICYSGKLSGEVKYMFSAPTENSKEDSFEIRKKEDDRQRITDLKTKLEECKEKRIADETEKQRAFMETSEYSKLNTELSQIENKVFFALVMKRLPAAFKETLGMGMQQCADFRKATKIVESNLPSIIREFIRTSLSEKGVNYSKDLATMLSSIMNDRFANHAEAIASELDSHYNKMESNIQKKIEDLKRTKAVPVEEQDCTKENT